MFISRQHDSYRFKLRVDADITDLVTLFRFFSSGGIHFCDDSEDRGMFRERPES
jgi:hypothetical protein